MIKHFALALALSLGVASLGLAPTDAEAKRLGGGKAAGMQRQAPAKPADASPPAQQPGAQPGAAAAGKRSWMGPLAGLAAGIGLAALFSHFGMGEGLANIVTMLLFAVVAVVAIRWLMARFGRGRAGSGAGGLQMAGAGAGAGAGAASGGGSGRASGGAAGGNPSAPLARQSLGPAGPAAAAAGAAVAGSALAPAVRMALPDGMDPADFVRVAKQVFIRMQAANDAADVDDLRRFTTPELFASLRADLLERGNAAQQTDVVQLDAEVVDVARDDGRDVVSVRFSGLVREQREAGAEPFNELWHLVRPAAGGDWAIAGITPQA